MPIISENRQVLTLNDLSKRKVVEHNSLITSIAKMDKTPLKMFELAVSLIDTENPPKDYTVYLSKQDMFAFFKVDDNDKHSRFKEAIDKMQKQAFFQIKKANEKGFEFESIVPIPYVKWTNYNDEVKIEFHREIMPYLINLKNNFTQYALSDIAELNGKYSIILYRWLSMNYNKYEHYSIRGGRREEQIESYRNPKISMRELRQITDTVDEYKEMSNFTKKVLNQPLDEITKNTSFNVTYEKVKKGRSIDSIIFHIDKKAEVLGSPKIAADREETDKELFIKATFDNEYTDKLNELGALININPLTDKQIFIGLQRVVYPLYDEIKSAGEPIDKHIRYISGQIKANEVGKSGLVGYLKKSAEQELERVKNGVQAYDNVIDHIPEMAQQSPVDGTFNYDEPVTRTPKTTYDYTEPLI